MGTEDVGIIRPREAPAKLCPENLPILGLKYAKIWG